MHEMYQSTYAVDTVEQSKAPVEWCDDDVKVILSIPGHYMLANRRNAKGERCQFTCRIVNVSIDHMVLAAPVLGQLAERVIVYSEPLGRLHGMITRLISDGFVMSLATSPQTREILVGRTCGAWWGGMCGGCAPRPACRKPIWQSGWALTGPMSADWSSVSAIQQLSRSGTLRRRSRSGWALSSKKLGEHERDDDSRQRVIRANKPRPGFVAGRQLLDLWTAEPN
jgi:hypothetical protein